MNNQKFLDAKGVEHLWSKITPEAIGAASDGYGYGGTAIYISPDETVNILIANGKTSQEIETMTAEEFLNASLDIIFSTLKTNETKMIRFIGYPNRDSNFIFFGILTKSSSTNGTLLAWSTYKTGRVYTKARTKQSDNSIIWSDMTKIIRDDDVSEITQEVIKTLSVWEGGVY